MPAFNPIDGKSISNLTAGTTPNQLSAPQLIGQEASTAVGTPSIGPPDTLSDGVLRETLYSQSNLLTGYALARETLRTSDASAVISGQGATTHVGAAVAKVQPNITGQQASTSVGTFGKSITKTLTGQAAVSHVGSMGIEVDRDQPLIGLEVSTGIGAAIANVQAIIVGVEAVTAVGADSIEVDVPLVGVTVASQIGTFFVQLDEFPQLTGLEASTHIGATIPNVQAVIDGQEATTAVPATLAVIKTISGQVAHTHIGAYSLHVDKSLPSGVQASTHIGTLFQNAGPNQTTVRMSTGVLASTHIGSFVTTRSANFVGQHVTTAIGSVRVIRGIAAIRFDNMMVTSIPGRAFDTDIRMSWSDDKGATFNQPLSQSLGETGEYLTNLSWRRLGMGRDRIYALEYSCDVPTAITGAFVVYEVSAT